jgi:hypothetical protein
VSPTCFQCHRTTPMESSGGNSLGYHSDLHTRDWDMHQPTGRQRD